MMTRAIPLRLGAGAFLCAAAALCAVLALTGQIHLSAIFGVPSGARDPAKAAPRAHSSARSGGLVAALPPPSLVAVSHDAAGSEIDTANYASATLHGRGSFLVYLPSSYGRTTRRYPVLYLLHGMDKRDSSFLDIGLQGTLDRLIARRAIPPLIAVMIQGGPRRNYWRNHGPRRYESYVLEVQELVDRMLPTVADRSGRAIAGYSMGGYGAMNIALGHPERFSVVESWLGVFYGLQRELRADRPLLSRMRLHAFLYGAASDEIADPSANAPFAAALRAAGARAESAVYAGGHTFETLHAHLGGMLAFAGRALAAARWSSLRATGAGRR